MSLPFREDVKIITAHRNPTPSEIKFGYGAIHYKDFPVELWVKKDGLPKSKMKCPSDGLMYYR